MRKKNNLKVIVTLLIVTVLCICGVIRFFSINSKYPQNEKVVYKMAKETVTASAGGPINTAHGIIGMSRLYDSPNVFIVLGSGSMPSNYYYSGTDYFTSIISNVNCSTITPNVVASNSRTVYWKIRYIKV